MQRRLFCATTSTCFETDEDRGPEDLRQYSCSRDKRGDCRQVVIALIVTPEGFALSCEVMSGDTADATTLSGFLQRIEQRCGRADRIWVMDRGISTLRRPTSGAGSPASPHGVPAMAQPRRRTR